MENARAAPLLERDGEVGSLARTIDRACGGDGCFVLVEGPPGIGKTRLVEAVRGAAAERGMEVLGARASELDREFPFGVVRQLFEPHVGAAIPGVDAAEPETPVARYQALYSLTARLARDAPLALAIDDAHWADRSSLEFLQFLLPRLDGLPVLVVAAARAGEGGAAVDVLATDPLAVLVRPAPLSHAGVGALVESELGAAPDPAFAAACHSATGGNPFLVRELLRELAREAVAPEAAAVPLVGELAPATVARAVLLRLARLGDDAAALARAVAVLGDGVPLRRACALAELPAARGETAAAALTAAEILGPARPLAFAHPILRSAVYADLEAGARGRAHGRAAELLAAEGAGDDAVAVHLLETEPAADQALVRTLEQAADRALARGAASTSAAFLRRALAEPPPADARASLLRRLAIAELRAGEAAAAAERLEEAAALISDASRRSSLVALHATALQALGRHDEAFAQRERAVEDVRAVDPGRARLLETGLVGSARLDLTRVDWARERLDPLRGLRTVASAADARLLAMGAHLDAFSRSSDASAATLAESASLALDSGLLVDETTGETTSFYAAVELLMLADRVEPAREALDRAVETAARRGSAPNAAFALGWRCLLLARDGALLDAEADARQVAELSYVEGWFAIAPMILGFALDVLVERGELDDAGRLLERSGMADRSADRDLTFDPVVHARARLRAARGDLPGARADLESLERRDARWNTFPSLVPPALLAPELAAGDAGAEQERAERLLSEARTWDTPRAIGMALRARGLAARGAQAIDALTEAAELLAASPARLEEARALTDLGAALRSANRRTAAREPLRRALDRADAAGAVPLAQRARRELRAAGGRPRRTRITGAGSLTASERRVADMAAAGLSNPEIARSLFVTKKTVETHLANAYGKLGIRSRAELPEALRG
ncbi:MAG: AAA family ATPase [Thermoleophilaceae bacterium]